MLTASADYISAVAAADRQVRAYLRFNNTTNLRGYDGLISIDWYANLFDEERPSFGCAVASYIEAKFYNNNISGISYETSYVDAYIGVVTKDTGTAPSGSIEPDTATVEYMNLGRFYISEVETDENIVTITAYDVMSKLSKNYVPTVTRSSNGYAIKDICNDIFSQCGTGFTPLTNNYGYVDTVYEGTCREQLGWMCSLMFNNGDTFVASRKVTTGPAHRSLVDSWGDYSNYTITDNVIYEGGIDIKPNFTINSITSGTADNPIVAGNGVGLERENPNITQSKVTTIYNNLNGKTWTPMTIEFRGDPRLMVGDVVKVTHKGTNYRCYIQHMHTIFNGGMSATIDCYGDSEATYQMSTAPTAAKIDSVKTEIGEIIQRINAGDEGYCTKILDANGNWSEFLITDQQDYTQATSVWRFNLNGLSHSTSYSGGTYSFALDDQGRIVANRILVGRIQGTGSASYWDFDNDEINLTGSFTMTGGSINIATGNTSSDVINLSFLGSESKLTPYSLLFKSKTIIPALEAELNYNGLMSKEVVSSSITNSGSFTWTGVSFTNKSNAGSSRLSYDALSGWSDATQSNQTVDIDFGAADFTLGGGNVVGTIYIANKTTTKAVLTGSALQIQGYSAATTRSVVEQTKIYLDSSSVSRASLEYSGLTFKNSSGTVTATYPSSGYPWGSLVSNGEETSDLDNCTDSGRYTFTSAAAHNPYSAGGVVDVYKNSSTHYYQLAFSNSTANDDVAYINVRKHNADGFHAWQRIITPAQGVVTLNGNTATSYSTSGTTQTFALDNGLYLVTTSRTNSTSTAQDGVWLVQSHTTSSHLTALLTPSGTTTISITAGTLTLTTGSANVRITITKLS